MITIKKATNENYQEIIKIGKISVFEAHRGSCKDEYLDAFIEKNYNDDAVLQELRDEKNLYYILYYNETAVGFSKVILNAKHPNVSATNITKLERIYLLSEVQGLKLGYELLKFNIDLAKNSDQVGLWLFTWVGNLKAIQFYTKVGFKIIGSHQFYLTDTYSNLSHQMFLGLPEISV